MVVFASARASWLFSLAVLGFACNGTREDPSPGAAPPAGFFGSTGDGGGGEGGGVGGGNEGGSSGAGVLFEDCGCAAIIESNTDSLCSECVGTLISSQGSACVVQLGACQGDPDCALAQTLLLNNSCNGDPDCTSALLTGILNEASADLLFGYYSCLCVPCAVCEGSSGLGGGGIGGAGEGGGSLGDGSCEVNLK